MTTRAMTAPGPDRPFDPRANGGTGP
jgi:hypothetical protein